MSKLQLRVGEASAKGPRAENQDALRCVLPEPGQAASKGCLFALADGVSHCADGRLAAQSTVQALALDYFATPDTWTVAQSLERLLQAHNRWLHAGAGGQPLLSTLTALVVRGRRLTLAHVGDCRAYRFAGHRLQQLSQDHVWQQPGMEHVLTRALGLEQHVVMDFHELDLTLGDSFIVLSDGVWSALGDRGVRDILQAMDDPQAAATLLVETAHRAGGQDNASAIVICIDALPAADWRLAEPLPLPPALIAGQVFEGWEVLAVLGASRQSRLYRVGDAQGQAWLLKTLPSALANDAQAAQQLLMEEWFLRRVPGRAFAQVHPGGQRQSLYYVQREYPGQTLAAQLQGEGPLPQAQWFYTATRLLRAVGQLHRRNLLHRDIKPENLHRGRDGELRLLDFGLMHCPGLSAPVSEVAGTPSYIAPELYRGAPLAPQQDLFAVGVTLFKLLTGKYPYGEVQAFQVPRQTPPHSAQRLRGDVPPWQAAWLQRCLAFDPAQRFETAEQALLQLERGEQASPPGPRPLLQRDPSMVWRAVAVLAILLNLLQWLLHVL